jgi:diguanylate cyclase (GGDEF)-like protein
VELQHQATHDMLTGLPNRVLLHERITRFVGHARQTGQGIAVLFIDLDRFKSINDSFGHSIGDALLTAVASRLRSAVRDSDVVARLSGDEFVVVLSGITEKEDVESVAKKVLGEISRPYDVEQHELCITGSIGVSVYPRDGDTSDMLLRSADAAMYCAKDQTGSVKFYSRALGAHVNEHIVLESSLRQAVDHQEFEVYYQPQVDIKSGRINGVEALIRWRHPKLGMISPDRFIPLAEETGLIVPIGEWVLRTACAQVKAWHVAGFSDLTVAVNFSARQFQKNDLFDLVRGILDETKLDAEYLEIELTESLLMKDSDVTVQTLRRLKEMGSIMALDDFGTGYSSLSYLRRFPIDVVKIDCSFIRDVTNNLDDALLTKAIISMAKSLNLKTVAEGVETEGQLNFLKENQCDTFQGYYFSRPLPADDITAMLFDKKQLPA